jgi:uncharacterized membrane protein
MRTLYYVLYPLIIAITAIVMVKGGWEMFELAEASRGGYEMRSLSYFLWSFTGAFGVVMIVAAPSVIVAQIGRLRRKLAEFEYERAREERLRKRFAR